MARLQELLSRAVSQNFGISEMIDSRAGAAGQSIANIGMLEAQSEMMRKAESKQEIQLAEQVDEKKQLEKDSGKKGMFETIGTVLGSVVGFTAGGLEGASIGGKVGGALGGGVSGTPAGTEGDGAAGLIQGGIDTAITIDQLQQKLDIAASKKKELIPKLTETQKAGLDFQKAGKGKLASKFTDDQLDKLPPNAFQDIGTGEETIRFVKNPKQLSPEAAAKLAGAQEGKKGVKELLTGLDKKTYTTNDFKLAATPGIKRAPGAQTIASKLDFNKEVLARIFSGAAVPETEQTRFQSIFSVQPLDTIEVIKQKLQRTVDMVERIENSIKFGASITDGVLESSVATQLIDKELTRFGGATNVIKFDATGKRIE